jgi:hypothetical protein
MSGTNKSCSIGGHFIAYVVVTGSTLASMAVVLFAAVPTLLQH